MPTLRSLWTENNLKTELFDRNDDITTVTRFSCPRCPQTQPVIVMFSNFFGVMWVGPKVNLYSILFALKALFVKEK